MSKVQRPLELVIDATIKLVPQDFKNREEMIHDLEKVKESIPYTAPEAIYLRWEDFVMVLESSIGNPNTEWKIKIADLVANKIDYQEVLKNA